MKSMNICAMIAAAGSSHRMGFPKALMPIKGEYAALALTRSFKDAGLSHVYVTLPHFLRKPSAFTRSLEKLQVSVLPNSFLEHGYAGSIMSVVASLPLSCEGLFITPIDCYAPLKLILTMKIMAQSFKERPLILVPECYFQGGHPVYLSKHFFTALRSCNRFYGLNHLINFYRRCVVRLPSFENQVLANINDLEHWYKNQLKGQSELLLYKPYTKINLYEVSYVDSYFLPMDSVFGRKQPR